ncbi:cilia- and flagella-associated protein 45-like [Hippoglossus stenolepis]|uniref:cilia- and flagella-associated protein 45-like n=1 Tax=Hippoglossus stenolepis TaxID=195615 RepID=UPI00159C8A23|nr:cilia- and flagella-associated protein 45-like [Hippoglossus stenolepis]
MLTDGNVKRNIDSLIRVTENAKNNNALIQERKQTQAQLLEEEKRLDYSMNSSEQRAEQAREEIKKMRKQYADKIKQRNYNVIMQRLAKKELQETMGQLENEKLQEMYDRMKQDDLMAMEEKKKKMHCLGEEMRQILDEKMQDKERRREEEKLADMKIISQRRENLKQQADRDVPRTKQIEMCKKQDLVFATLEVKENRRKDSKSKQEALSLQRVRETKEREWITQQKNLAEKRAYSNAMMKASLSAQVLYANHLKKIKADQQKADAERIIEANNDELDNIKEKMRYEKNLLYSGFLKQQMMERQLLANAKCREETEEAKRFIVGEQEDFMCLGEYKEKVLKDAEASGVPDNYLIVFNRKASYLIKKENPCPEPVKAPGTS